MSDYKIPVIELFEYNFFLSLIDFLRNEIGDKIVNNKQLSITQSYFDKNISYKTPALTTEIMYRKNRSIGFGNFYGENETDTNIIEIDGTLFEYRVQLNVYSNSRGEIYKWNSILDEALRKGQLGISLNTYNDNGTIKQSNIGNISYDFSQDVKNNYMNPNIGTYDHHTIYEIKMTSLQQYKVVYDIMEIGDLIGQIKAI